MAAVSERTETFVGTSVKRKEDASLLRGRGTYVDNMTLPGLVFMAVVRSPYAHARIKRMNVDGARQAEGVGAAFSCAGLAEHWKGSVPGAISVPPPSPLAIEEAGSQGDGVAVVIAESRALAKDAAELVEVEYEPLPAETDVAGAVKDSAPLVHAAHG